MGIDVIDIKEFRNFIPNILSSAHNINILSNFAQIILSCKEYRSIFHTFNKSKVGKSARHKDFRKFRGKNTRKMTKLDTNLNLLTIYY